MMTNQKTIGDIKLLGGHPALDYVNTVDSRGERCGPEFLNSYSDLVTWARRVGLIDDEECAALLSKAAQSPPEAQDSLNEAKEFREALCRIFMSESDESPIAQKDLRLVTDMTNWAQSQRTLTDLAGIIEWRYASAEKLNAIAERIGWLAAELLTSRRDRRPVRACQGPNCGWLFLDHSRNGHRRWCSDKTCGSHSRVRKFRAVRSD
ncbi:CGNR zinc finger domain-containing protein [Pararhizobium sp. DWP3-4]|uniref:CGNR zinc finger domain-containing protein n=1 Tax=Pararhizobium sp. DWP3-4 TaxID=2804565 RepID=UPI003CF55BD5